MFYDRKEAPGASVSSCASHVFCSYWHQRLVHELTNPEGRVAKWMFSIWRTPDLATTSLRGLAKRRRSSNHWAIRATDQRSTGRPPAASAELASNREGPGHRARCPSGERLHRRHRRHEVFAVYKEYVYGLCAAQLPAYEWRSHIEQTGPIDKSHFIGAPRQWHPFLRTHASGDRARSDFDRGPRR